MSLHVPEMEYGIQPAFARPTRCTVEQSAFSVFCTRSMSSKTPRFQFIHGPHHLTNTYVRPPDRNIATALSKVRVPPLQSITSFRKSNIPLYSGQPHQPSSDLIIEDIDVPQKISSPPPPPFPPHSPSQRQHHTASSNTHTNYTAAY